MAEESVVHDARLDVQTQVEHTVRNVLWGVTTRTKPGDEFGPPQRIRVLQFSTGDESEIWTFPLPDQAARAIAAALVKEQVHTATTADMAALKGKL